MLRKPLIWVVVAALLAGGLAGLYWFQPWKLVVDDRVDEALSGPAPAGTAPAGTAPAGGEPAATVPAGGEQALVAVLAEGTFVTHEHETRGTVRIIQRPDGTRRLEIVELDTSNGPDLWVWLSDQPVIDGRDGWSVFDDGRYAELGRLKGNKGSQGYDIPAGLDLSRFRSVSIWCKRFAVSFGAATLNAA